MNFQSHHYLISLLRRKSQAKVIYPSRKIEKAENMGIWANCCTSASLFYTLKGGRVAATSLAKGEGVLGGGGGAFGILSVTCFISCFRFIRIISKTASSECLNLCPSPGNVGLSFLFSLRFPRNASVTASKAVGLSLVLSVLLPGHSTLWSNAALILSSESSMLLNRPATCAGDPPLEE